MHRGDASVSRWKLLSIAMGGCICIPCIFLFFSVISLPQYVAFTRVGDLLALGLLFTLTTSLFWVPLAGVFGLACLWRARANGENTRGFTISICVALIAWGTLFLMFALSCAQTPQCLRM